MAKDRAAPFSRKHRKYWLPVTGGMVLIGFINVAISMCVPLARNRSGSIFMAHHDAGADAVNTLTAPANYPPS